jgi:hypothetical protein
MPLEEEPTMKLKKALATTAAATVALVTGALGLPAAHAAEPPAPYADILSVQRTSTTTALVAVRYLCLPADELHLWVSVKQGGPDPQAEGSSATVDSWYDDHPRGVVCNGHTMVRTFPLTLEHDVEWLPGKVFTPLVIGQDAWVQFCLFHGGAPIWYGETLPVTRSR